MKEKTLAIIKPDAVAKKHSGNIINMIEQNGFEIVNMEKLLLSQKKVEAFYEVHKERPFFGEMVSFMTSGPVVVMALEKENAVADWRALMGETNPENAADGTVRKLYGSSIGNNAAHGSDSLENAEIEVQHFFEQPTD